MRLAYVDPQSYHGLAKYDAAYLAGLLQAGFDGDVRFYCSTLLDLPVPSGVEVRPIFNYSRKRTTIAKLLSYIVSMLRLLAEGLSRPADVYHFQWFKAPPLDLVLVLLLRRLTRARIVLTVHNAVPHGEENGRHPWLGRIYRAMDAIVVHHASTADEIAPRFSVDPSRFSVLRHGSINLEPRGQPRHKERVENFAATRDICFLFLGRGSRYKGLDLLLHAWQRVVRIAPGKPGLVVMGSVDEDLKELASRAARRERESLLVIDEHVAEGDLFHAVNRCDVVVLPHRRISQSGILLAVLGQRTPVLVASRPGLLEPLAVAPVGWKFDGTEDGLVDRLTFLAAHSEAVADVRDNEPGWDAVREAFAWNAIAERGIQLYRDLLCR